MTGRDHARIALATIRLVNGAIALLAPEKMLRRLGADPDANQVAIYPLRMFGIRTVVLGVDLLAGGSVRQKGRVGVIIHATDAASAITAGLRRALPARVALAAADERWQRRLKRWAAQWLTSKSEHVRRRDYFQVRFVLDMPRGADWKHELLAEEGSGFSVQSSGRASGTSR